MNNASYDMIPDYRDTFVTNFAIFLFAIWRIRNSSFITHKWIMYVRSDCSCIQVITYLVSYTITLEKGIPRGIIGLNYLSKFVCTQWAVWLMYSSSRILVGWKFYFLTNNNASSGIITLYLIFSNTITYYIFTQNLNTILFWVLFLFYFGIHFCKKSSKTEPIYLQIHRKTENVLFLFNLD